MSIFANDILEEEQVNLIAEEIHRGKCPVCHQRNIVDAHNVYKVWSALVMTQWTTTPKISCFSCARKRQLGGILFSVIFGWWGIPWGLIATPLQIGQNVFAMTGIGYDPSQPSELLKKLVRLSLLEQIVEEQISE
jgi:hypothetical protein